MSFFLNLSDTVSRHHFADSTDRLAMNENKGTNARFPGLFNATRRIFQRIHRDRKVRQTHQQLSELNDDLLKDIGFSRDSIDYLLRDMNEHSR